MGVKNKILTIIGLLFTLSLNAQVINNEGKINVSGGFMVIRGNYQNESTGSILLNGTIQVSGNWTNNGTTNVIETPGTDGEVVFNGTGTQIIGGTSSNIFDFEKLTINSGSTTQVEAGKGVTAYGACSFNAPLILKSTTTPYRPITATFINESTVTGNISMELSYTSTGSSASGTGRGLYFSSPISNATSTIFNVAAGINLLWYQDEVARKYVKVTTNETPLTLTKGYIMRSTTSQVFTFTGTPNAAASYYNDDIVRVDDKHYYLLGNPYPSVINWDAISKTNISPTIWFNTSTTSGSMVVDTWNIPLGIGTMANGTAPVNGQIAPMQSFWIQCATNGSGSLTISENNRSHDWGTSQFIKKSTKESNNNDILRLYLNTNENLKDETIIVQSLSAEDEFGDMDSRKMFLKDGKRAELFTISPEKTNLVIQSFKPIESNKDVRLGFYAPAAGQYKFSVNLDKFQKNQNVFLEDKQLNTTQDLLINPEYVFTSEAKDDTSRFVIHFAKSPKVLVKNTISVCEPQTADLTVDTITAGSDLGLTFSYWTDPNATVSYATPELAIPGTYYIKGTTANGAYFISEPITVITNPKPVVMATSEFTACEPSTIDLTATSIYNGSTQGIVYSYWSDENATIPYTTPNEAKTGRYYVKGVDNKGCVGISNPISVTINPKPTVVLTNPDAVVYPSTVDITGINITAGSTEGLSYSYWLDQNATVELLSPKTVGAGNYFVKGTVVSTGCYSISGPLAVTVITDINENYKDRLFAYGYSKRIHINNCPAKSSVFVYDITGKLLYTGTSSSTNEVIPFNFNAGIYLVKVLNGENVKSFKVFID